MVTASGLRKRTAGRARSLSMVVTGPSEQVEPAGPRIHQNYASSYYYYVTTSYCTSKGGYKLYGALG